LKQVEDEQGTLPIFYGWKIVGALFVILAFTSGLGFYNHSVILAALSSEAGFPLTIASSAVSVFFLVSGFSGLIIGSLLEKYDVRLIIGVGAVLASTALVALGYVKEVWQLYFVYIIFGAGFSASGLLPATTLVARWFHHSRAKALSFSSTGLSLGGVLITPLSASLVANQGIAIASPWMGLIYFLGVMPVCIFILRSYPSDMGLKPDGGVEDSDSPAILDGVVFSIAIKGRYFWVLSISYLFVMLAQVGGIAHQYGIIAYHLDATGAAYGMAILPLFSILGRLAGGVIIDKVSTSKFTAAMMLLQGSALGMMAFATNTFSLFASLALFGITVGNLLMLQPLLVAEVYGLISYSRIYSWSNFITILGIASGPALMGYLATVDETYQLSFLAAAVSGFLACSIFVVAGHKPAVNG
jgi:MFS family permease